jgi:GNAT superfamily N-acetyltransferase
MSTSFSPWDAFRRRFVRREAFAIVRCLTRSVDSAPRSEGHLLQVRADDANGRALAAATMQRARQAADDVERRFAQGDRFFAWMCGDEVASFGWITTRPRDIEGVAIHASPTRAMVYDVFTRPAYRGRSMATSLLSRIAETLAREGCAELVASVDLAHAPSNRALQAAGFAIVARVSAWVWLDSVRAGQHVEVCDASAAALLERRDAPDIEARA